jgi:hypothetical protein
MDDCAFDIGDEVYFVESYYDAVIDKCDHCGFTRSFPLIKRKRVKKGKIQSIYMTKTAKGTSFSFCLNLGHGLVITKNTIFWTEEAAEKVANMGG